MPLRPILIAVLLAFAAGPSAASAQDAPLRVAVVDVQRLLTESEPGRQRSAAIEALQQQLQSEGERLQQEAVELRQRIADLGGSTSDPELQRQLDQKVAAINQFSERATRDLSQRSETVLRELEQIVMPAIQAIGDEGGYTLVFRKFDSGLVYVAPYVDVTDRVIARVNAGPGR